MTMLETDYFRAEFTLNNIIVLTHKQRMEKKLLMGEDSAAFCRLLVNELDQTPSAITKAINIACADTFLRQKIEEGKNL